jgi:hypothetical protein
MLHVLALSSGVWQQQWSKERWRQASQIAKHTVDVYLISAIRRRMQMMVAVAVFCVLFGGSCKSLFCQPMVH